MMHTVCGAIEGRRDGASQDPATSTECHDAAGGDPCPSPPIGTAEAELRRRVRNAYVASSETVTAIIARHGISLGRLHRWRAAEGWPARGHANARRPSASKIDVETCRRELRRDGDLELTERLRALIARALDQLETSMSDADPPSAADLERETRAIGSLIKNLEKVTELETDRTRARRADAGGAGPEPGIYDNEQAELKRRALAERLERVRERYRRQPARRDDR